MTIKAVSAKRSTYRLYTFLLQKEAVLVEMYFLYQYKLLFPLHHQCQLATKNIICLQYGEKLGHSLVLQVKISSKYSTSYQGNGVEILMYPAELEAKKVSSKKGMCII